MGKQRGPAWRRWIGIGAAIALWSAHAQAAQPNVVVTLGANLTPVQRQQVVQTIAPKHAQMLTITHQDEERLLSGVAPQSQIGTRAISSSAVIIKPAGSGLAVRTYNITWVTPAMYANALATAGVKDAKVVVDAPFAVSGTAALAGILTAYQSASGSPISFSQQQTAAKEMVATGDLGDQIGSKSTAATLVLRVKNVVVNRRLMSADSIRPVVVSEANQLHVTLNDTQINTITQLMVSVAHFSLNGGTLQSQLKAWEQEARQITPPGLWQQIVQWLRQLLRTIAVIGHKLV